MSCVIAVAARPSGADGCSDHPARPRNGLRACFPHGRVWPAPPSRLVQKITLPVTINPLSRAYESPIRAALRNGRTRRTAFPRTATSQGVMIGRTHGEWRVIPGTGHVARHVDRTGAELDCSSNCARSPDATTRRSRRRSAARTGVAWRCTAPHRRGRDTRPAGLLHPTTAVGRRNGHRRHLDQGHGALRQVVVAELVAGPGDPDEVGVAEDLFGLAPREDLGQRIGAGDEEQLRVG